MGYVLYAHGVNGKIFVKVDNGYELEELHNVRITSVANDDLLQYDSSIQVWKNSAISSILPNGLLKIASAISTTFQAVTDYLGNVSVLFLNSRRIGIGKDTSVTTQSVAVVEVQDANTSIVLKPNGTGAIIASVPDGTTTGGNARGSRAVDLSSNRGSNTSVASGTNSAILGGYNNRASGNSSSVAGGDNNIASNGYAFVGGGTLNTASGEFSTISGGYQNTASSQLSTISGGQSNTASTNTHATVVGGQGNTSSGQYSVTGGTGNTASAIGTTAFGGSNIVSGQYSLAVGRINNISVQRGFAIGENNVVSGNNGGMALGQSNTVNSEDGIAIGGNNNVTNRSIAIGNSNTASAIWSIAYGVNTFSYIYSQQAVASGRFVSNGDAQQSLLTARNSAALTTGATLVLSLDGTGTTNLIIPNGNNRAWNVQIDTIAVVTAITGTATGVSVGNTYQEKTTLSFKRIGGASSLVALGSRQQVYDTSMATAIMNFSAGASQQLQIQFQAPAFTGGGSITCRVVSKVSLVEVAY